MKYFVYIMFSKSTKQFYKGQSSNVETRIKKHNAGYEGSTKHGRPWILVWKTEKDSRSDSVRLEKKLKNLSRNRLISFMKKYDQDLIIDIDDIFPND